ncbi:MAG: DUF5671 domain-containing protein [Alphaproteobacteria bacterium]|nr:MAG: hypothetical protein B6I23_00030 [Rickettsiaceae bacterium 4572_127]
MKPEQELCSFVKKSLEKKVSAKTIKVTLLKAGWKEKEVDNILKRFTKNAFQIPVKKEVFLYSSFVFILFNASLLWVFGISLSLIFSYLNFFFPYGLSNYQSNLSVVWEVSNLIVLFPVLVFLFRKNTKLEKEKGSSSFWKILINNLVVFILACILIGDLITFVYFFLKGGITTRFVLKVLVILFSSLILRQYYIIKVNKKDKKNAK